MALEGDFMLGLGRAISERRRASSKTQEDLAYEADLSLRHLQKIEAGHAFPRLQTLFAIAEALEVKAQYLLDLAEARASQIAKSPDAGLREPNGLKRNSGQKRRAHGERKLGGA